MKYVFLIGLLATTGCSSLPSTPLSSYPASNQLEERALISNLSEAYETTTPVECSGDEPCTSSGKTSVIYKDLADGDLDKFIDAGTTLSDLYCDRFFRAVNQASRKRQFARGATNDAGGAIAAVLGLVKAGSGITGGTAAGFSFLDSTFRNYDESFLVDANIAKMRRLVLAAQDDMKLEMDTNKPSNVFRAETSIIRYSSLCSFLGMQELLDSSIEDKIEKIETSNETSRDGGNAPPPPP
jgi:hypothetical protein